MPKPGSTILVVDDTEAQRYAIARTLRASGFVVEEAVSGAQALELAQKQPDLILLDVMLPDMDGFEVCRRLKSEASTTSIPVIEVSAHFVDTDYRVKGLRGGADDYVAQPVTPDELVAKINVWVRARRAEAELRRKNAALEAARAELQRRVEEQAEIRAAHDRAQQDLGAALEDMAFFSDALQNSSQAFAAGTPDGRLTKFNRAFMELTGYTADELRALTWAVDLTPAEWRDRERRVLEELHRTRKPQTYEKEYIRKDGKRMPLELALHVAKDANGRDYYYAFITDISGRKEAEKATRESERRFRSLFEHSADAVFHTVPNGRILAANPAACTLFRMTEEEIRQAGREGLLDPQDSTWIEATRARNATGRITNVEIRYRRKNGEIFVGETSSVILPGEESRAFVVVRDISERKRAEELLIRSEKVAALGRMAASLAHDINNPLAAVTNSLFLARHSPECPESVRQFLDLADEELKRISHITKQALGFYREDTKPTKTRVHAVLDEAIQLFKSKTKSKRVQIEKQYRKKPEIIAVPGELRQVFSNLIANSIDATDEGGVIKVRVSSFCCRGHEFVRVTVADDGRGIRSDAIRRIFEPLFTTKGAVGTGLGLWVSKQLIEKQGGLIRVHSSTNPLNRGTTVSIILPSQPGMGMSFKFRQGSESKVLSYS